MRAVVEELGDKVILANADCDDATHTTLSDGVGFPRDHVFKFDSGQSESLMPAWDGGEIELLAKLWQASRPY